MARPTNRWTGAAAAYFASSLLRRRLREIAPPGQLNRSARSLLFTMSVLLIILFSFIQGNSLPTEWDCVANTQPPNKQVTRLKPREINERVLSCKTPVLPGNFDATGAVIIEVLVNETGDVACLRAISGASIFRAAALDAARKWKFKPLVVDGTAKPYSGFIVVYVSWDVDVMEKHCPALKNGPNKSLDASGGSAFRN